MTTQRLTIAEAAEQLDVSEITVRRRLKAGTLNGEQEETAQGYRWIVILETSDTNDEDGDSGTDHEPDQTTVHEQITTAHALVTSLEDQIGFLRRELEVRNTELAEMRQLMAMQQQSRDRENREILEAVTSTQQTQPPPPPASEAATEQQSFVQRLRKLLSGDKVPR